MKYDPIKSSLGSFFNKSPYSRILFYKLLDLLLLRTWHVKKAVRSWKKHHSGEKQILDAGSGFGQYSYYLAGHVRNAKITAVDVKEDQIRDCNAFFDRIGLNNASFMEADLTKYVEENTFDFILSVDVMEHIEEDVLVFKNFHKSLKDGGMVLISTPSDQGGSDVHHHDHDEAYNNDGSKSFIDEHVRDGYNINEIQEKLKTAGFSKTESRYQYGAPGKISWRLSMKYPILILNRSKAFAPLLFIYYLIVFPFCLVLNIVDVNGKHKTGTGLIVKAWK
ncbi:MAG: class I SAM-dependent methyltransferase [Bacteroidales bacterium]|nr:class I SAM-dependent methyltransferase [Bacteroidales bacterium]MCF8350374.1 class I SAM-dependent methyltransferase [Bacteroidales bacterium]MCF8376253.1 class I SAM-dependent methyltransferase [Bacteroidales bacterium]MCF8401190.1 class I SAM-dependent methyltransferase [Bacteroidales bacterium]